ETRGRGKLDSKTVGEAIYKTGKICPRREIALHDSIYRQFVLRLEEVGVIFEVARKGFDEPIKSWLLGVDKVEQRLDDQIRVKSQHQRWEHRSWITRHLGAPKR